MKSYDEVDKYNNIRDFERVHQADVKPKESWDNEVYFKLLIILINILNQNNFIDSLNSKKKCFSIDTCQSTQDMC